VRRGGIADRLPHGSGLGITQHLVRLFRAGAGTTVEGDADGTEGLDNHQPAYLSTRIYSALLDAEVSELAARRMAMKAATDNANDITLTLRRQINHARQAQVAEEINEIISGADAHPAGRAAGGGSRSTPTLRTPHPPRRCVAQRRSRCACVDEIPAPQSGCGCVGVNRAWAYGVRRCSAPWTAAWVRRCMPSFASKPET